jgi:hypothetical protein
MLNRYDGQPAGSHVPTSDRALITFESGAEQLNLNATPGMPHPGAEHRSAALKAIRSEHLDRSRDVRVEHEQVDVLREPFVAVLDHREPTRDAEGDS